jgi:hypothetical protein
MVLLALRFLAELGMLGCLGVVGWRAGDSTAQSIGLAVVLPLVVAVVWGRAVAPRAPRRLRDPARLALEVLLFAGTLVAVLASEPTPALTGAAVAVVAAFAVSIPARGHEPTVT